MKKDCFFLLSLLNRRNLFQIIKAKKEEFFAKPEKDQDTECDENENFKTPQIFIQQLFKLYKKNLVDDTMIKDQVNLLIFGVTLSLSVNVVAFPA